MIALRKTHLVLVYGKYTLLDKENLDVFAYTRELKGEKVLVLLSFSNNGGSFKLPNNWKFGGEWINNYSVALNTANRNVILKPWQAVIVKID